MKFNNFEIFPMGGAKLNIENGVLKVKNVLNTGTDGILIKTEGHKNYTINFGKLPIQKKGDIVKSSTLKKTTGGHVFTAFESYKRYDDDKNAVVFDYNIGHLPEEFYFVGKLKGKEIFRISGKDFLDKHSEIFDGHVVSNEKPIQAVPSAPVVIKVVKIVISVIAIGVGAWATIKTKKTTTITKKYDKDGNLIEITEEVSEDPEPFDVIFLDNRYTIDEFCIDSHFHDKELEIDRCIDFAELITVNNIPEFEIVSIQEHE